MAAKRPGSSEWSQWIEGGVLAQASHVDDWIAIEPDGTITVFSGKVELGTGVKTALAQIVAEELDVPFERIKMVMGDTALTPDEGYTAGSTTIQFGGFVLRQASAEARLALLEMASDRLDAAIGELIVQDGVISVSHHPSRTITYAELLGGKKFRRRITLKAPLKRPEEYRIVGRPIPRVDLPRKITGAASFVHDVRLPGMLHARVVRPPSPSAKLVSLDESSVPGVQVIRLGNFVGVIAEREERAVRAAQQIKATWREPSLKARGRATHWPKQADLYSYIRSQPTTDNVIVEEGKVDAAFKRAATRLTATYAQPFQAHASIGPSCAVADVQANRAVIWSNSQGVFPLRGALAELLKMSPDQVQVIHAEGAGSYGHNGSDDAAADAAILSQAIGKPVRMQWSRQDEFAGTVCASDDGSERRRIDKARSSPGSMRCGHRPTPAARVVKVNS
jgi:CO/xanthine dehydrogenase Mo-binding subunit